MKIAKSEDDRVMEILYFQMDFRVHVKNINKQNLKGFCHMEKTLESSTSSCEVKQTKGTQFRTSVLMGYM